MGKFKDTMKFIGDTASAWSEHENKVNELTDELMKRTYNADREDVKKVARVLITQAEVTWK